MALGPLYEVEICKAGQQRARAGACTIQHYGLVIYRKWSDFVVYWCVFIVSRLPLLGQTH